MKVCLQSCVWAPHSSALLVCFPALLIALTLLLSSVCLWAQMKTLGELKQLQRHVKCSLIWGVNWIPVLLALGDRFPGNFTFSLQIPPRCDSYVYVVLINRLTIQVMMLGVWEMYVIYTKDNNNNTDDWCGISGTSIFPVLRVSGFMV